MARWSEDTTLKFVTEYIKHECLWDVTNESYKNKQMRQAAYLKLQETMGIEGFGQKEIVQKIKNIRSTYSQERKKIRDSKKSGAAYSDLHKPSLKWYYILDNVLRSVDESNRKTQSNMDDDVENKITEGNADEESQASDIVEEQSTQVTIAPTTKTARPTSGKKRKLQEIQNIMTDLKGLSESINSPIVENEFEVFGRNVGLQLKSMPICLALQAQEHIQTYLSRLRLQHLQEFQYNQESSRPSSASSTTNSTDILSQAIYNVFDNEAMYDCNNTE